MSKELLGSVSLEAAELTKFVGEAETHTQWIPLHMDIPQDDWDALYSDEPAPFGELKLRAGFAGASNAVDVDSGEYVLEVLSAYGLAKSDAFGKSDPFAIVEW